MERPRLVVEREGGGVGEHRRRGLAAATDAEEVACRPDGRPFARQPHTPRLRRQVRLHGALRRDLFHKVGGDVASPPHAVAIGRQEDPIPGAVPFQDVEDGALAHDQDDLAARPLLVVDVGRPHFHADFRRLGEDGTGGQRRHDSQQGNQSANGQAPRSVHGPLLEAGRLSHTLSRLVKAFCLWALRDQQNARMSKPDPVTAAGASASRAPGGRGFSLAASKVSAFCGQTFRGKRA
jgi:hypothetical protein